MVKRRDEFARGQIAARAEDNDGARLERLAFGTHVTRGRIIQWNRIIHEATMAQPAPNFNASCWSSGFSLLSQQAEA
jgi:hypothetical protein